MILSELSEHMCLLETGSYRGGAIDLAPKGIKFDD